MKQTQIQEVYFLISKRLSAIRVSDNCTIAGTWLDGVGDFTGPPLVARVNWPGKGCSSVSGDASDTAYDTWKSISEA